jgi:hypothetical protein
MEAKKECGEAAMEMEANVRENPSIQHSPDVSVAEHASHELVMRILKLRWMGMDDEAERMQVALHRIDPQCTLVAGPFDTD